MSADAWAGSPEETTPVVPAERRDALGRGPRVVVLLLGAALLVHSTVVALWLSPSSPLREAVGGARLASYVDPYFQQGDDTAGIDANRVDETLQVKAFVRSAIDAEPEPTDWVDVTGRETRAARGDLDPARALQSSRRVAVLLNAALFGLEPAQRELVSRTEAGQDPDQVRASLLARHDNVAAVDRYLVADEVARAYASLWLGARMSDVEIIEVRYRVGRRLAPRAGDHATSIAGEPFAWANLGWRTPFRGTPEARAAFDQMLEGRDG